MSNAKLQKDPGPEVSGLWSFSKLYLILAFIFVILISYILWYGNGLVLTVIPEHAQKAFYFPVQKGDEWSYEYIHSVQKTPCLEVFQIQGAHDMIMTYTKYQSYGVGLPCYPEDGTFSQTEDGHFILVMNRPFSSVQFRTHEIPKPRLFIAGQELPLYKLYESGSLVEVTVEKRYKTWLKMGRESNK